MSTEEIIEGNNILAVFMGGRYANECTIQLKSNEIWLPYWGINRFDTIRLGAGHILEYHKSWDWLVPVIQKLSPMSWNVRKPAELVSAIFSGNVEIAWIICVENIKHHNRIQIAVDE